MSKALTYRADIDTLRAVAVLSVVCFHFSKTWLPGGLLGVEVFFVISGFLITLILHREMNAGVFSFKNFYVRRMKRILPVFFVVVLTALVLGAMLFTPDDFAMLSRSALASVLFAANFYFARGQGYFDPAQEEKPLLHIWSLSVEEQYYFVFPILLLLVVRRSYREQMLFMALLMLMSLLAAYIPTGLDKYYLPHLRAFEMLTGSMLAVFVQQQTLAGKKPGEKTAACGSLLAGLILLACLWFYHPGMPYFPGWAGLVPCAATAALIYYNGFDHRFKKLFQWRPLVWVGLISYSLYLWHFLVLAFARYLSGTEHLPDAWLLPLAILMLICTLITYYGVEQPIKSWKPGFAGSFAGFYALPAIMVAVAVAGFQQSAWIQEYRQQGLARADTSCHNTLHKKCVWGAEGEPPSVLMLGDSHADQYKTFIDAMGKKEGWSAKLVSADTCAFVRKYDARVLHNNASCRNVHQYADEHLAEYPIVMLAMRWGNQIKADKLSVGYDEQFFDKLDATLAHFAAENKTVYLFTDNPAIQYSALRAYKLQHNLPVWAPVRTLHKQDDNVDAGNAAMRAVAAKHGNVHIVDAQALLPDNFLFNGKPVYADLDHINPFADAELAKRYGARFSLLPSGLQTKQTQAAR